MSIHADVVATGIPGAGAIAQIGKFHTGGPFHDNPAFAPSTQPGQVLDGRRLFVASSSNFGAPLARPLEAPGAILSIDVSGGAENPVAVPADFATQRRPGERSRRQSHSVQRRRVPPFINGVKNPNAVTNALPSVSLPLGISFNNGFGRPWFANAPNGSSADGTISVVDPGGFPLEWCARSDRRRRVHGNHHESKRNVNRRVDQRRRRNGARDEISRSVDQSRIFCGARRRQRPAGARSERCRSARAARLVHADRGHQHRRG